MRYQQPLKFVEAVAKAGSIRKAADTLAITSTALNRRILAIEEDIGAPLFERLPSGVRLSAAGEIFIHFARRELSEAARMQEQVDELAGIRRGHVNMACGQSLMQSQLPNVISDYRQAHGRVTITVQLVGRSKAAHALETFAADVALVLEAELTSSVEVMAAVEQPVQLMCRHDHPLLERPGPVRLDDCFDYPMALPTSEHGVRHLLNKRATELGRTLPVVLESTSSFLISSLLSRDWTISFGVPAGGENTIQQTALAVRPVDSRDLAPASLSLLRLRGRSLPVAAARFAERLVEALDDAPVPTCPVYRHEPKGPCRSPGGDDRQVL